MPPGVETDQSFVVDSRFATVVLVLCRMQQMETAAREVLKAGGSRLQKLQRVLVKHNIQSNPAMPTMLSQVSRQNLEEFRRLLKFSDLYHEKELCCNLGKLLKLEDFQDILRHHGQGLIWTGYTVSTVPETMQPADDDAGITDAEMEALKQNKMEGQQVWADQGGPLLHGIWMGFMVCCIEKKSISCLLCCCICFAGRCGEAREARRRESRRFATGGADLRGESVECSSDMVSRARWG